MINFRKTFLLLLLFVTTIIPRCALSQSQRGEFTLQIIDEETRQPLPCRVRIRNEKGVARKAEDVPFLYDHFVMPGKVKIDWPLGTYPMEIERGLEYLPRTGHFVLNRFANDSKTETLKRFTNLSEKGWWSGDLMVLRNLEDAELLMLADDLYFMPLAESREKKMFSKQAAAEKERTQEERVRAGRLEKKEDSNENWFDSNRLFTTQNYILRHPACCVGILNLPKPIRFENLKLETRRSAVPMLYAMRHNYPDVWIDVQDADCWDLPLLVALNLADSFQILGPHILHDQLLPENICWQKLPASKTMQKINTKRLLEENREERSEADSETDSKMDSKADSETDSETDFDAENRVRRDLFHRPSQCGFIPDAAPMNYRDERGRQTWTEAVYFHLLNTGHKIPPSAGSGSGLSPNAVGANRMYVYVDPEEFHETSQTPGYEYEGANAGWTQKLWWDGLRAGRVVVTNGPLLMPWVEGCVPGEVFDFPENVSKDEPETEKLNPSMTLMMQQKAQYIDVIVNGRVAQSIPFRNYAESGRLPLLEIQESGWFLIRIVTENPQTYCCVMTAPYYVQIGKQTAISKKSAQFFVNWERKRIEMLENRGDFEGSEGEKLRKLHEYTLSYWENLLKRATRP